MGFRSVNIYEDGAAKLVIHSYRIDLMRRGPITVEGITNVLFKFDIIDVVLLYI